MASYPRRGPAVAALVLLMPVTACTHGTARRTATPPALVTTPAAVTTAPTTGGAADATWSGTWNRTSAPPTAGTMTMVLHSAGGAVSGTITVQNSACLTEGPVNGTVNGTAVTLHATTPAVGGGGRATGDYAGTLARGRLTGTLTVTCAIGTGVGTFDLSRE